MAGGSKPSTMSTLDRGQKGISDELYKYLRPQIGQSGPQYPGNPVAPLDQGYGQVQDLMGRYSPETLIQPQRTAIKQALSGQPSYNLDPAVTDKYFTNAVETPAMRSFQQHVKPQIDEAYAGQGALWSSRRGQAVRTALTDVTTGLNAQRSTLAYNDQQLAASLAENAKNRQLQGVQAASQFRMEPLTSAALYENLLQPFQQNAQAQSSSAYEEWTRTLPQNSPWTSLALGYIGQTTQSAYNKSMNPYAAAGIGAVGGAASGALIGSAVPGIGTGVGALLGAFMGGSGSLAGR